MLPYFKDFDPITFLNLEGRIDEKSKPLTRVQLTRQIGQYIFFKLAPSLTDEQLDLVLKNRTSSDKFDLVSKYIPNLEERMKEELENFKLEFNINGRY